jgi:hypothetical protein
MKLSKALAFVLIFFSGIACQKESEDIQNILYFNNLEYSFTSGKITVKQGAVPSWLLEMNASVRVRMKSLCATSTGLTISFTLVPVSGQFTEGDYSIGDKNLDGMINASDAFSSGYITEAIYSLDGVPGILKSEIVTIKKAGTGYTVTFHCHDSNNMVIEGTVTGISLL